MDIELSEDFAIIASESPDECDRSQLAIFAWLVKVESNTYHETLRTSVEYFFQKILRHDQTVDILR